MSLNSVGQKPAPGGDISLFRFDATPVGGTVMYFATGADVGETILFGGVEYLSTDIEFTDFEVNGQGSLPTPKVRISNTDGKIQEVVNLYGDLLGCELRRVRTFARFLDGQPEADPTAFYGPDVFEVEKKSEENPIFIEWELSAAIDQDGKMLPGRVIIRDTCLKRYRRWDPKTLEFIYPTINPCRYDGPLFFDVNNQPCAAKDDRCARSTSACKLRFGAEGNLPFGGFPGAQRPQ